jgi:MerR family mercuric resistance operon transcriptional regulator
LLHPGGFEAAESRLEPSSRRYLDYGQRGQTAYADAPKANSIAAAMVNRAIIMLLLLTAHSRSLWKAAHHNDTICSRYRCKLGIFFMVTSVRAQSFPIGKLAERTRVNIETIRYYERVGLLPPPPRTEGRHRAYDEGHVQRLSFIRRSRELGFSLDDVRTLLQLAGTGNTSCCATKELTLRHLVDVRSKIASLKKLERALKNMTDACEPSRQLSCPIIDALSAPS